MQPSFFDLNDRHTLLEQLGDPLPKIDEVVDWEGLRPALERIRVEKGPRKGGCPPLYLRVYLETMCDIGVTRTCPIYITG